MDQIVENPLEISAANITRFREAHEIHEFVTKSWALQPGAILRCVSGPSFLGVAEVTRVGDHEAGGLLEYHLQKVG